MSGKGKTKTILIKLVSTAGTGFFYSTTKNPRNVTKKLSLKKVKICFRSSLIYGATFVNAFSCHFPQYDPVVRQHVLFTESKMK